MRLSVCVLCALFCVGSPVRADGGLAEAERWWDSRAERLEGRLALPEATERALAAYLREIDAEPGDGPPKIEARWKALRAAHYLSEFTTASEDRAERAIASALELSAASRDRVGAWEQALDPFDLAQLFFWSAIVWGAHGQRVGLLTIVREGVARRMFEDATRATALDATIERGGALRLLSRLHADLPRVPFISGWVDRDAALPDAERAYAVDPNDPGNRLVLALALRDFAPERLGEARELLTGVAEAPPRARLRAEDLAIREEAAETLSALPPPE